MTPYSGSPGPADEPPAATADVEAVFERIDDGVFALDADDRFTFLNSHAEELLGVTEDAVLGETIWDVFPGASGTTFEANARRAMETQEPVTFEAYYESLAAWFEVRLYPDDAGLSAYFRDVTDRKEREEQLEAYETGINAAADLVYRVDPDGRFTMVNDTLVERTGYSRESLLGAHVSIVMSEDDVAAVEAHITTALNGGVDSPAPIEFEVQCADGERFPVETNLEILREDGVFAGTVGVGRDVTERRERQRELERFEEIINAVDDVVYALDDDGCFELVNDAAADLTGYDREELLGEHVGIIKDDATVDAAEEKLRSLLVGQSVETTFEFSLQPKEGSDIPAEDHMTIVYDDDGSFTGTAGVIRDITAQQERQRKLSGLVETTQDLMDAPDQQGVAQTTLEAARDVLGFELSTVRLYDDEADALVPAASTETVRERMADRPTYAVDEPPVGEAFQRGEILVAEDLTAIDDDADRSPLRSAMYVPIGEYGVLVLGARNRTGSTSSTDKSPRCWRRAPPPPATAPSARRSSARSARSSTVSSIRLRTSCTRSTRT